HVDAAFRGTSTDLVQLKYTWLIDKDAVTSISSEDTFGNFKVTGASLDMLTLTNDNSITLNADSKITFLGNMYFQTSELGKSVTGTGILFYPAKEVTIGGAVPTTPTTPTTPVTPVTPVVNDTDTTTPADTTTPVVTPPVVTPPVEDADEEEPVEEEPGFEAIFAIAGLLAVAFFVRRN
ncbi:MAG: S-layer protein domain-containing protein, partial [Methanosarcinaceae archaeon]|nr:S-layer protein domain-containing protein [Methanosarcinaceae archaeon]